MKKCPYCGAQMSDDSLFCTECGKPVPQGCVCPHCGAGMNEGDVFCQSCGKKVDESLSTKISDLTQKACPYCGALVNDGDVFCGNCGKNLPDGSIGFTPNEIQQETYVEGKSSTMKILPIILCILAIVLIGGGLWYWNSPKKGSNFNPSTSSIVQKGDSINEAVTVTIESDSIEEVVDSAVVDEEYYEEYGVDTVATDNYERYIDAEEDESHCWYVFGTENELKEQRIIVNNRVSNNPRKEYFSEIGINEKKSINLYSKNAEVLSNHPSDSYELAQDDNGYYKLSITDPSSFWSNSKYLVIVVK